MARLTKEQWEQARALWEGDPEVTFQHIADIFGCSRPAVGQKAEKDGWVRGETAPASVQPTPEAPPQPKPEPKVSPPAKPPKVSGKDKPAKVSAKSNPPPDEPAALGASGRLSAADWQLLTGKRPVGRPTEYRAEYCDEMIRFFDIPVQSVVESEEPDGNGGLRTVKRVVINTFPTITRFASKLGVTRQTLHEWATITHADGTLKYPEFAYAYARAKDFQDALLVEGGLSGCYEGRFATLAAKNLIGWKDQVETKTEVNITPVSSEELDNTYAEAMAQMEANRQRVLARKQAAAVTDVVVRG